MEMLVLLSPFIHPFYFQADSDPYCHPSHSSSSPPLCRPRPLARATRRPGRHFSPSTARFRRLTSSLRSPRPHSARFITITRTSTTRTNNSRARQHTTIRRPCRPNCLLRQARRTPLLALPPPGTRRPSLPSGPAAAADETEAVANPRRGQVPCSSLSTGPGPHRWDRAVREPRGMPLPPPLPRRRLLS